MPDLVNQQLIEPDAPDDEEKWYKIQFNGTWYAIRACCRSCATRKTHEWLDGYATLRLTPPEPNWLIRL